MPHPIGPSDASFEEDTELDHEELRRRLAESFAENGWDEPGMEAYDHYSPTRTSP
jgi:hypothetical protein